MLLPREIRLTNHAKKRLEERNAIDNYYNTKNIMRSTVKWYGKDDLIHDCALYRHCCYVTRKSNQLGYITDGNIEVIYSKETKMAVTILEVKDKFRPINQYIKPELLDQIEIKKEKQKMKSNLCKDCGKEEELNSEGICVKCNKRKINMKSRGKKYIPYLKLSESEKKRIDSMQAAQAKRHLKSIDTNKDMSEKTDKDISEKADTKNNDFIQTLRDYGCEIPDENLQELIQVLITTDKLKDMIMTITKNSNQQAMLDLEQALNVIERKLQHDWEFNGFKEEDGVKFKNFLMKRRVLKSDIFFWKKLYQTNTLIEIQRAWNTYTQDPNDKILLAGDRIDSIMKRYQITTESISTIFNTRRPFTRIFYATDENIAYELFKQWLADRNLHEDPKKTTIVELKDD